MLFFSILYILSANFPHKSMIYFMKLILEVNFSFWHELFYKYKHFEHKLKQLTGNVGNPQMDELLADFAAKW